MPLCDLSGCKHVLTYMTSFHIVSFWNCIDLLATNSLIPFSPKSFFRHLSPFININAISCLMFFFFFWFLYNFIRTLLSSAITFATPHKHFISFSYASLSTKNISHKSLAVSCSKGKLFLFPFHCIAKKKLYFVNTNFIKKILF